MQAQEDVQLRALEALTEAQNYNQWLADLTAPYLGDNPLEIGSGLGGNAALWLEGGASRLTVSELTAADVQRLERRFADDARVAVREVDVTDAPEGEFSACVGLNVLEHIEDDVGALRSASRLVRPGGAVVFLVPAFDFASGRFDRLIGHHRRYTRDRLAAAFREAGLDVESVRYLNAPGLLTWLVSVRLLRQIPSDGPLLRLWDRAVVPVVRRVERGWAPPFGQSVLGVARRGD